MNIKSAIFNRDLHPSERIDRDVSDITREQPRVAPVARRAWSARAAEVEGYVENLEADVVRLQQECQSWERAASLAEGERDQLRAELAQQRENARQELDGEKTERQRLERLIIALDSKFALLAPPIVEAMTEIRGAAHVYAPKPEMMRSLAREIEGGPQDEQAHPDDALPSVVIRGPAEA
jgi:chromosome segregation ATPase